MKLNHGDLKATQGDTGHSQINMITDVYAQIIDEDRKINAQKFETTFYTKNAANPLRDLAEALATLTEEKDKTVAPKWKNIDGSLIDFCGLRS